MLVKLCSKVLCDENPGAKRLDGLSCHPLLAQSRQDIGSYTALTLLVNFETQIAFV